MVCLGSVLLAASVLPMAAAAPANAEPTTQAAPSKTAIAVGSGRFTFTNWQGPDIPVWTYRPETIDPATAPIVFVMHGVNRDPDRYRDEWISAAQSGGFVVIAPGFSRKDFPGARGYNLGGVFERREWRWRDESVWSFSAIEPLFDEVVARLGSTRTQYTIYGHSAGSQFVHRFAFFKPRSRAKRFIAANAGWYTFADRGIAFPFGLEGIPITDAGLRAVLAKDMVILLGDADTDGSSSSFNRSEGAMRQGPHRLARGKAFFQAARKLAEERGWEFGWSLQLVEGVAHSNAGMAASAAEWVE